MSIGLEPRSVPQLKTVRAGAIVLAGSHGWSGAQIPGLSARPLAPVALRPLVSYPLAWLRQSGMDQATICANGSSQAIKGVIGDDFDGLRLSYEEDRLPRGSGGCIRDAGLQTPGDRFIVVEGSLLPSLDLHEVLSAHERSAATLTVVTHDGGDGLPPRAAGVYIVERRVLEFIADKGFQDLKENVIPKLHRAGERVASFTSTAACLRVSTLETYLAANYWLVECIAAGRVAPAGAGWIRHGDMTLHPSAKVSPDVLCIGPALIGRRANIPAGVTIVGPTVIGDDAVIEPGALVSRSVLGNSCRVAADAMVHGSVFADHSIAGENTNLWHALNVRRSTRWSRLPDLFAPKREPRVAVGSIAGTVNSIADRRAAS